MQLRGLAISIATLPFVFAASALGDTSVTDRVASDKASIEVTSEPAGTMALHLALMRDPEGDGLRYLNIPATQTTYTPPTSTPVVDVQALGQEGTIGGWGGRLQTTPAVSGEEAEAPTAGGAPEVVDLEEPAEELAEKREDGEELEAAAGARPHTKHHRRRKLERAESERAEEERAEEEQPEETQPPSSMVIGVDSGGWGKLDVLRPGQRRHPLRTHVQPVCAVRRARRQRRRRAHRERHLRHGRLDR